MSRQAASLANWQALSDQLPESCLRIASYNVHGCVGTDGRKDAARIAQVIAELDCDTVGLQEVDYRLDYIAGRVDLQAVPGLTLLRHDGPFGNALLTRRKILEVRRLALGYCRRETRVGLGRVRALLASKPSRRGLRGAVSDPLRVKAIVATQTRRWDPSALSKDAAAAVRKSPFYVGRRPSNIRIAQRARKHGRDP